MTTQVTLPGKWSPLNPGKAFPPGAPVLSTQKPGSDELTLLVVGTDKLIWQSKQTSGAWSGWVSLPATIQAEPGTVLPGEWSPPALVELDIFFPNLAGAVSEAVRNVSGNWNQGGQVNNQIVPPGAAVGFAWKGNEQHLAATDANGVVWWNYWKSGWKGWAQPDSTLHAAPGAPVTVTVSPDAKHIVLLTTNPAGNIYASRQADDGTWTKWLSIGGMTTLPGATVTALWTQDGSRLNLFYTDPSGLVWSTWTDPDFSYWKGHFITNPDVAMQPGTTVAATWQASTHCLSLYATGTDGTVWTTSSTTDGTRFPLWEMLGGDKRMQPGASVSATWRDSTHVSLFVTDAEGFINTLDRVI